MKLTGERTITNEQVVEVVAKVAVGACSKGAAIRELFAGGLEVKEIAELTGIKYNHVYNVVKNEVLVHRLEVETSGRSTENSKKAHILAALEDGKTITQVATEMQCLYNYVWQIAKAAGYTNKQLAASPVKSDSNEDGIVFEELAATEEPEVQEEVVEKKSRKKKEAIA